MTAKYVGKDAKYAIDQPHSINVKKMSGRIYKPGKGTDGKWLDNEGTPDNRFMVWGVYPSIVEYKVYSSADAFVQDWAPANWNDVQAVKIAEFLTSREGTILRQVNAQ